MDLNIVGILIIYNYLYEFLIYAVQGGQQFFCPPPEVLKVHEHSHQRLEYSAL